MTTGLEKDGGTAGGEGLADMPFRKAIGGNADAGEAIEGCAGSDTTEGANLVGGCSFDTKGPGLATATGDGEWNADVLEDLVLGIMAAGGGVWTETGTGTATGIGIGSIVRLRASILSGSFSAMHMLQNVTRRTLQVRLGKEMSKLLEHMHEVYIWIDPVC